MSRFQFRNWAGTAQASPRHYHQPSTEHEVVTLVRRVRAAGERLRTVGAGHSWNDICCTGQHLLNLDRLARVVDIDRERCRVTVEAGIRLKHLSAALDGAGLALPVLGSIQEQSIAGAIATGTHGSGARYGNLATQVIAMRLVDGTGRVHELDAERDPERFAAARVSLGCLGVVTQVTLRCEPAFRLEEHSFALPFERAVAEMQGIVDSDEHVKLWWLPHTDYVQVYRLHRTQKPRTRAADLQHRIDQSLFLRGVFGSLLWFGSYVPTTIPPINRTIKRFYFVDRTRVDRSDRVFNTPMPPLHREMEYAIPREAAPEALTRLRRIVDERRLRVNFLAELRFVAADDILLSPAHGRATCQIGAYIHYAPSAEPYFDAFEQEMLALDGRPHWGKEFSVGVARIRAAYPAFERFLAVRRELDPDGVFTNGYIRRVLGA